MIGHTATFFPEFTGGGGGMIFIGVDSPRWDFPVGPINDKAVVLDQHDGAIGAHRHYPHRWAGVVDHVVPDDDAAVRELYVVLVQADPVALMHGMAPQHLPWALAHRPLRLPWATSMVYSTMRPGILTPVGVILLRNSMV